MLQSPFAAAPNSVTTAGTAGVSKKRRCQAPKGDALSGSSQAEGAPSLPTLNEDSTLDAEQLKVSSILVSDAYCPPFVLTRLFPPLVCLFLTAAEAPDASDDPRVSRLPQGSIFGWETSSLSAGWPGPGMWQGRGDRALVGCRDVSSHMI